MEENRQNSQFRESIREQDDEGDNMIDSQLKEDIPQGDFNVEDVQFQLEKYKDIKQEYSDTDTLDYSDVIFERLCDEEALKKKGSSDTCFISQKKFTMMGSAKKQCKFCGNVVMEQYARKYRKDPQGKSGFKRICDQCEEKYLKKMLNQKFKIEKDKLDQDIKEIESKQRQLLDKIKEKQLKLDQIHNRMQEEKSQFSQEEMKTNLKINRIQQESTSLQADAKEAQQKLDNLDEEIDHLYKQKELKTKQIQEKKQKDKELEWKIKAIDADQAELQIIIDIIERKITDNNLRMEKLKTFRRSQNNSSLNEEKISGVEPHSLNKSENSQLPTIREVKHQESNASNYSENSYSAKKNKKKKDTKVENPGQCGVESCKIF